MCREVNHVCVVSSPGGRALCFQKNHSSCVLSDDARRREYDRQLSPMRSTSTRTYSGNPSGPRTWQGAQGRGNFRTVDEEARRVRQEHEAMYVVDVANAMAEGTSSPSRGAVLYAVQPVSVPQQSLRIPLPVFAAGLANLDSAFAVQLLQEPKY
ncbi:unnamed protein product [Cladocopium goreaui]|uniref:Uncharacterized protein n=1 Tax=Cladocopium goreaui TaxID=2562237 RepID=A0A9P1CKS5_9DINO|nr:unnamed protein product [Cladocopium goreaui]